MFSTYFGWMVSACFLHQTLKLHGFPSVSESGWGLVGPTSGVVGRRQLHGCRAERLRLPRHRLARGALWGCPAVGPGWIHGLDGNKHGMRIIKNDIRYILSYKHKAWITIIYHGSFLVWNGAMAFVLMEMSPWLRFCWCNRAGLSSE